MGLLHGYPETADQHVRLPGTCSLTQNRPFFIKDSGIEDLDKTATNIIISTLFMEASVTEYQLIYFRHLDKMRRSRQLISSDLLKSFVDIVYRIHLKIIKNATNKKMRTIYTELYGHYQKMSREYYTRIFKEIKELNPTDYF